MPTLGLSRTGRRATGTLAAAVIAGAAFGGIALASTHAAPKPALSPQPPAVSRAPQLRRSPLLKKGFEGAPGPRPAPGRARRRAGQSASVRSCTPASDPPSTHRQCGPASRATRRQQIPEIDVRASQQHRRAASRGVIGVLSILALAAGVRPASAAPASGSASAGSTPIQQAADDLGVRDAAVDVAASQLASADRQLGSARRDAAQASAQSNRLRRELTDRQRTLARALTSEVLASQRADAAERRVQDTRSQSKAALRSLFTQSPGAGLQALAQGGSLAELSDRVNLLSSAAAARARRLDARSAAYRSAAAQRQALSAATSSAHSAAASVDEQASQAGAAAAGAVQAEQRVATVRGDRTRTLTAFHAAAVASRQRYETQLAASERTAALLAARAQQARTAAAAAVRSAAQQAARAQQAQRAAPPAASSHPGKGAAPPAAPPTTTSPPSSGAGPPSDQLLTVPTQGTLSSGFGYRDDPFGLGRRFHPGQDLSAPLGTPIVAATGGTVALVQTPDQSGGYGNYTCIDRGAGFSTCYAHQSAVLVQVGQQVAQGQLIGLVGSTGASTGPHLHFEVRINGEPVDPAPYLP